MLRRYVLILSAVILLLAGCAIDLSGERMGVVAQPTPRQEEAAARITFRDNTVTYISMNELEELRTNLYGEPGQPAPAEAMLNELISRQLLLRHARATDATADPRRMAETIANVQNRVCSDRVQAPPPGPEAGLAEQRAYLDECARTFGFADGTAFRNFIFEEMTIAEVVQQEAPKDQIKVAHILVNDQETAASIYYRLCGRDSAVTEPVPQTCRGAAFRSLAARHSTEPGAGQSGGELPVFDEQGLTDDGQRFDETFVRHAWELVPTFEEGQEAISRPFQTQFGWHIVRVLDRVASRDAQNQYRQRVLQLARESEISDLQQPYTRENPLIGVAEILGDLPEAPVLETPEPVVPIETPTPDVEQLPLEATPGPDETPTP